jgi:hypothetical protein
MFMACQARWIPIKIRHNLHEPHTNGRSCRHMYRPTHFKRMHTLSGTCTTHKTLHDKICTQVCANTMGSSGMHAHVSSPCPCLFNLSKHVHTHAYAATEESFLTKHSVMAKKIHACMIALICACMLVDIDCAMLCPRKYKAETRAYAKSCWSLISPAQPCERYEDLP